MRADRAPDPVDAIVTRLLASPKTRCLHPDFLRRMAARACDARRSRAEALKAAQRTIHQAHGAYWRETRAIAHASRILERVAAQDWASDARASSSVQEACRQILALHASTRERSASIDVLYKRLWEITGPPNSVLDVACGLNPFTVPWMDLAPEAVYFANDVDCAVVALCAAFLQRCGANRAANCCDVVATPPEESVDVALFLKSYPCFELQQRGSAQALIASLRARWIVVSFPARTLGGREVGMKRHYRALAEDLMAEFGGRAVAFSIPNEMFYVFECCGRESRRDRGCSRPDRIGSV